MKCIIVYFSQTGNTEKIAKAIQEGIKQKTGNCNLVKIKEVDPNSIGKYDLIGIGSPCFGEEPRNVSNFINALRFVEGKHAFSFVTHGGNPDFYFPSLIPKLKNKGLVVIGTLSTYGDCYLLHHIDPYPTKGHPDKIDLEEAMDFGREMVENSRKITAGETRLIVPTPLPTASPPDAEINVIESFSSMVKYHKEKCKYPKCHLCIDNCPMGGIDLSINPPVIANPCHPCEFCARICPTGAIDMDEWCEAIAKRTLSELYPKMLLPALEKAEAEGHFRRLLPKDEIHLSLDHFGYKLHKKHPQWIIGKGPQ